VPGERGLAHAGGGEQGDGGQEAAAALLLLGGQGLLIENIKCQVFFNGL